MTFSIVGSCERTGMAGVAITTSSICVGSRCPWVLAGAGAVTTQNVTDPTIGNEVLGSMADGMSASEAVAKAMDGRVHADYRQVAAVDLKGGVSHFTGANILGTNMVTEGNHCVAAGNLLSTTEVPAAMVREFEQAPERHLAERLLAALQAGIAAGGEEGDTHSAGLLVAHEQPWPLVDLRVDWTDDCPGEVMRDLWQRYEPEMQPYLTRALNPSQAPSYGVPGDE